MEDGTARREYAYDRRGNLTGETEGGALLHGYAYGAMNRLTRAWNGQGEEASYLYNGLGQRIRREVREGDRTLTERYLLDMTRPYHNLLGIEKEGETRTFYYDGNVAAMEEKGSGLHYYLQDELGSPIRVSGYGKRAGEGEGTGSGTGTGAGSPAAPGYLTYGYDEFGNDLYRELEESGIPSPYDRQGEEQPFGYTGYRYDEISGTYFAQAREYQPRNGRFTAEDVVKGNGAVPQTLNRYGYCWGNPVGLVDKDGKVPVLSTMPVNIGILEYIKDAYESYEEQREQVPAPEMPTDTSDLPDYTKEIDEWLQQKEAYFDFYKNIEWPMFPKNQAKIGNMINVSLIFYNEVKTGGPMDIKQSEIWEDAFGFAQPSYFIYHGEVMDPGTLGNITYGYTGAALFPDFMLYYGGGAVNMKNWDAKYVFAIPFLPNYGDAPEDYTAVKKGIEMWNKKNECLD